MTSDSPARARWRTRRPGPVATIALLAALIALAAPLSDPDLPEHLSLGAWIVRHARLPMTEPFAWTRAGAPYYAYSWLPEITYYGLLRLAGPVGLHLLQALVGALAVLAAAAMARGRGWSAGVAAALGALNFAAMGSVANELRPQQLLFVLVPLAWALADAAARTGVGGAGSPVLAFATSSAGAPGTSARSAYATPRGRLPVFLGHLAVGCLAANTHLFFPLTAAPLGITAASGSPRTARRLALPALLLLAGWLLSPYGWMWPAVFRLNLGRNVLLLRPPAIGELEPGFEAMLGVAGALALTILLLALPWWSPGARAPASDGTTAPDVGGAPRIAPVDAGPAESDAAAAVPVAGARPPASDAPSAAGARPALLAPTPGGHALRARAVEVLVWAAGLIAFAFAFRLLAFWWLTLLPAVGERLAAAAAALAGRAWRRHSAFAALAVLMLLTGMPPWPGELRLEGGVRARTLPTPAAAAAVPLAGWLRCRTDPRAGGRLFTTFNFGSYLTWRLPGYSVSIDGRTIFPDSVAREFAWALAGRQRAHARTWASADLALLPPWFAEGDAIAADTAWLRLTSVRTHGGATLWARRAWWARWGRPASAGTAALRPAATGC